MNVHYNVILLKEWLLSLVVLVKNKFLNANHQPLPKAKGRAPCDAAPMRTLWNCIAREERYAWERESFSHALNWLVDIE